VHEILAKQDLNPITKLFEVYAPDVARKAQAGQFIIVRIHEKGERIPLTVAGYDRAKGTMTLVVQEVGKTTMLMGQMQPGERFLTFAGPLGEPSAIKNYGTALCIAGGFGIAPIYPLARALQEAGNTVLGIVGVRHKELLFWEEKLQKVCDELIICTDDGSYGRKGLVTAPLQDMLETGRPLDHVFAIGPAAMMKFCSLATQPYGVPTTLSLNAIMIDGTGMCGGCRVMVGEETRFACVDGPEFDGHQVDWDLLMARQRMYLKEEKEALERWQK
jgi:ferredoxin--NADP+ reductase